MWRLLDLLHSIDFWLLRQSEAALTWAEEWLSLSQRQVEQGLIGLIYVGYALEIAFSTQPFWKVFNTLFLAIQATLMKHYHRMPESGRTFFRYTGMSVRMCYFFLWLGTFALVSPVFWSSTPRRTQMYFVAVLAVGMVLPLFYYVVGSGGGGERGRRRKLALAKLKELFGTEWIPKGWIPEPAGAGEAMDLTE